MNLSHILGKNIHPCLHVVHGYQGQLVLQTEILGVVSADDQRPLEAGSVGHRHGGELAVGDVGGLQSLGDQAVIGQY